jgi:tetratricopeptide (TPR) repeat protein
MSEETGTNETFNRRINIVIALVIAIIAVLGSFITKLESEASIASNKASVAEQQYYYQAIGTQISGKADVNHAFGTVYQLWYQYEVQKFSAQSRGEEDTAKTYQELKDTVAKTSSLFEPKYFNSQTGKVNLVLYEADEYRRELYELEEKQLAADEVASAWDDKSSTYILQLTLLAVAGFLLGLAVMTKAHIPTVVFAASGILLVGVISVWAYLVSQIPVIERPAEAITAYAEGASLIDQKLWDEALTKLNEAVDKGNTDTPYGRAYLLRAQIHSTMGNYDDAIADYQVAIDSGYVGDPTVDASLVQAFFYVGDFTSAIETGTTAIDNSPDNLALRQQVNMAVLASGDVNSASQQVAILLEKAAEKVKRERQLGDSNSTAEAWWLLNDAAHQYDQLADLLANEELKSPVKGSITDPFTVMEKAKELASQLRAGAIALKYDISEENASTSSAQIQINTINPIRTLDGKYVYKVDLELQQSGIQAGQLLSIVTYRNGIEEPSWSFGQKWADEKGAGTVRITLSPSYSSLYIVPPGAYTVHIYLNDTLMAQSGFTIESPDNPSAPPDDDAFTFGSMLDQFDFYTSDFIYGDYESYDWVYDDWYYYDLYYYSYDPYFFYGNETDYIYFLEGTYDFYSGYCTDPYDLSCYTASDYDGDGVPDEYDFCVYEPGPMDFSGCPISDDDADGDGVTNDIDLCPYVAGFAENSGCPITTLDLDSDGITDYDDFCPYEPGPVENGGCPLAFDDADGDGITNDLDFCPFDFGLEENNGCPAEGVALDYDGDGVSDDYDSCLYDPGPVENSGCPFTLDDADGDGITNDLDFCPYVAGLPENDGCPAEGVLLDYDEDGVEDEYDFCPYDPGPPENGGCPYTGSGIDSDGDGVEDDYDVCPYEPGPSWNYGCPDTGSGADSDGDGIEDIYDTCPNDPGLPENGGCPAGGSGPVDTDGDGVIDENDFCPNEPGPPDNGGCPESDFDGDGVPDIYDYCPDEPGPAENGGCPDSGSQPDSDGDGLTDDIDFCPNEVGPPENNGCP